MGAGGALSKGVELCHSECFLVLGLPQALLQRVICEIPDFGFVPGLWVEGSVSEEVGEVIVLEERFFVVVGVICSLDYGVVGGVALSSLGFFVVDLLVASPELSGTYSNYSSYTISLA
jgi:hypothetical protein